MYGGTNVLITSKFSESFYTITIMFCPKSRKITKQHPKTESTL